MSFVLYNTVASAYVVTTRAETGGLGGVSEVGGYEAAKRAWFVGDLVDFVDDRVEASDVWVSVFGGKDLDEIERLEIDAGGQPEAKGPC